MAFGVMTYKWIAVFPHFQHCVDFKRVAEDLIRTATHFISQCLVNAILCFLIKFNSLVNVTSQVCVLLLTKICSPINVSCRTTMPTSSLIAKSSNVSTGGFILGTVNEEITMPA